MPIKVFFPKSGDPYIEADSPQDALALLKLGSNGHNPNDHTAQPPMRFPRPEYAGSEDANVSQFFMEINDNARKLMLALVSHEKGVRGDQFSQETGVTSEKLGGIFGGASKIAKKYSLKIEQFVHSETVVKGTERYRFYKPEKLLLQNADRLQGKIR